jgi:hypothetical protein
MSRPCPSEPSRYQLPLNRLSDSGGVNPSIRLSPDRSKGFCGVIHGANAAASTMTATRMEAMMVTGEWR